MHDRTLIAIALGTSAIGLIALLIALSRIAPEERPLDTLNDGEMTLLRGTLQRVMTRGQVTVLTLSTESVVHAVLFEPLENLTAGDCVLVTGERSTFEGEAQLTVSMIARC